MSVERLKKGLLPTKTTLLTKHLEMTTLVKVIVQIFSSMRKSTNYCPDFLIICNFPSACAVRNNLEFSKATL